MKHFKITFCAMWSDNNSQIPCLRVSRESKTNILPVFLFVAISYKVSKLNLPITTRIIHIEEGLISHEARGLCLSMPETKETHYLNVYQLVV